MRTKRMENKEKTNLPIRSANSCCSLEMFGGLYGELYCGMLPGFKARILDRAEVAAAFLAIFLLDPKIDDSN